jgi:hypothetical protein
MWPFKALLKIVFLELNQSVFLLQCHIVIKAFCCHMPLQVLKTYTSFIPCLNSKLGPLLTFMIFPYVAFEGPQLPPLS